MHSITKHISQELPVIADAIRSTLQSIAQQEIGFILIVYTPVRLSYYTTAPDAHKHIRAWLARQDDPSSITPEMRQLAEEHPSHTVAGYMRQILMYVASMLELVAGQIQLFSLITFLPAGPLYASNADRADCIPVIRDLCDGMEAGTVDGPAHHFALH